jgi:hypothetical protein
MPLTPSATTLDPLAALIQGAATAAGKRPVPLIGTRFDVTLDGGLAVVETSRRYRNEESESIEATITFPLPVHATLFALEARIDGRILKAVAKRRQDARADYESAVERGKAAVLHEELLRGIHMLSVAHVPPGGEIEVVTRWAASLTIAGDRGSLRIPLTVGEVYGRSDLPDSDALIHGGAVQIAELSVVCRDGQVVLRGGRLTEGCALVPTNAPVDLEVTGWTSHTLLGRAADGRRVSLLVAPCPDDEAALDVAVLVDHSGSMGSRCSGEADAAATKHEAVVAGLKAAAAGLGGGDAIDLWQFDNAVSHVGCTWEQEGRATASARLLDLAAQLAPPHGGTEICNALAGVMRGSTRRDILLITDGKSHALDVQALARAGRRIVVLLVGEDSLEANVGHLAVLTGGEILVAGGAEIEKLMLAALGALRRPYRRPSPQERALRRIDSARAGALLTASWQEASQAEAPSDDIATRAVAAFAAGLALPALDEERAATLAEAEGLVTHLTSLVLVDEAGEAQEGLPATRKIALPSPRMADGARLDEAVRLLRRMHADIGADRSRPLSVPSPLPDRRRPSVGTVPRATDHPSGLARAIDWGQSPRALRRGDLSVLSPSVAAWIERAARSPAIVDAARRFSLKPVVLVLALLAWSHADTDRAAARLSQAVLGALARAEVTKLVTLLSLATSPARNVKCRH